MATQYSSQLGETEVVSETTEPRARIVPSRMVVVEPDDARVRHVRRQHPLAHHAASASSSSRNNRSDRFNRLFTVFGEHSRCSAVSGTVMPIQ